MGFVIDFDLSTIIIFTIIWAIIATFLRLKKGKSLVYLIFFTIFYIYLIKVLEYTQFPIFFTQDMRDSYGQTVWETMNLIPLINLEYRDIQTSLFNVLLTIPFGFGLPFIYHRRRLKIIFAGLFFGIIIELLQLVTALIAQFTFRIVDINDIIFNTLGVVIGYMVFILFIKIYKKIFNKNSASETPTNPILRYIFERS